MSLYFEQNTKTLKSFIFSKILRPNIGLIDPGPCLSFNNLVATNTLPCCQGASSTFVSYNGVYGSITDHILIPVELLDILSSCTILD